MKVTQGGGFVGGWFLGAFSPSLLYTNDFEVCVKRYLKGDVEPVHYQLTATEFTYVISGLCRIGNAELGADDIIEIPPMVSADFEALSDVVLVAVKTPSQSDDKRLGTPNVG